MYGHKTVAIEQMCAASTQRAKVWSDRRESLRQLLDVLEMLRSVRMRSLPNPQYLLLPTHLCVCVCVCVCGARVQVAVDPQAAARFHLSTKQCVAVGKSVSEAEKWLSDHGLPHASWDSALGPGAPLRCAKQRGHASMVVWNCTEITVTCLDIGLTCLDIAMSFPTHFPTAT